MPIQGVNNTLIAKNTVMLFFRTILLLAVSLYTGRVVLSSLGIVDYGIYNVVGGFIGLFAFLNGAMSSSSQRYITFALGKGDVSFLTRTFATCRFSHLIIAIVVFVLAETVGLWFVCEKLVIPSDRMTAAIVVYECSVLITLITIMSYPYNADIIAHEKMSAFAFISLYEAVAKLVVVMCLNFATADKLILYAILLVSVQISVRLIYNIYCHKNFEESNSKLSYDRTIFREIFHFTGWNLWGGMAGALSVQGVNVLLNIFFGPAVNAARGVSVQIQTVVQQFSSNFQTAINPQITKTYAANDLESMHTLIFRSSKFTFFILLCMILPISIETPQILDMWLEKVPDYSDIFVRLMLCVTMLDAVSNPIMIASAATGNVRRYQLTIGSVLLLIVPVAYISIKMGGEPYCVFIVHLLIAIAAYCIRIIIVAPMINLSKGEYIKKVTLPGICVLFPSLAFSLVLKILLPDTLLSVFIVCLISFAVTVCMAWAFGMTKQERAFIRERIFKIIQK